MSDSVILEPAHLLASKTKKLGWIANILKYMANFAQVSILFPMEDRTEILDRSNFEARMGIISVLSLIIQPTYL